MANGRENQVTWVELLNLNFAETTYRWDCIRLMMDQFVLLEIASEPFAVHSRDPLILMERV